MPISYLVSTITTLPYEFPIYYLPIPIYLHSYIFSWTGENVHSISRADNSPTSNVVLPINQKYHMKQVSPVLFDRKLLPERSGSMRSFRSSQDANIKRKTSEALCRINSKIIFTGTPFAPFTPRTSWRNKTKGD